MKMERRGERHTKRTHESEKCVKAQDDYIRHDDQIYWLKFQTTDVRSHLHLHTSDLSEVRVCRVPALHHVQTVPVVARVHDPKVQKSQLEKHQKRAHKHAVNDVDWKEKKRRKSILFFSLSLIAVTNSFRFANLILLPELRIEELLKVLLSKRQLPMYFWWLAIQSEVW